MKPSAWRWVLPLVALSVVLSWWEAKRHATGPHPRAQCLTDDNCQDGERCVVVPNPDGAASFGQCGEVCSDDSACANGWTCRAWVVEKGYLTPARGRDASLPREKVCAHQSVQ